MDDIRLKAIAEALEPNTTLTHLKLGLLPDWSDKKSLQAILKLIGIDSNLTYLTLHRGKICDFAKTIAAAVARNTTLVHFHIISDQIVRATKDVLMAALESNIVLTNMVVLKIQGVHVPNRNKEQIIDGSNSGSC